MPATADRRIYVFIVGAVAVLAAFAFHLFPIWDDGGTKIWAESGSPDHIRRELSDRPAAAAIFQFLAEHGQLKTGGLVFFVLAWGGMAAVAVGWCRVLGATSAMSAAVVALTLAPILCQTQFILVNPVIGGAFGVMLAHAAALLLVFASGSGAKVRAAARIATIALVFAGGILSEYGVAAACVSAAVLWPLDRLTAGRKSLRTDAVLLAAAAVATYWIYRGWAVAEARPIVRPELTDAATHFYRLRTLPLRMIDSLWQVVIGRTAAAVAAIDWSSKWGLVGAAFGAATASAGVRFLSSRRDERGTPAGFLPRAALVGLVATIVGLLPALLMGRTIVDAVTTRILLPMLPFAACLSACAWRLLLGTDRRLLFTAWFLFGSTVVTQGLLQHSMNRELAALNAQLRAYCDSDVRTLVVVDANWPPPYREPRGFELTARLTDGWPAARARNVWAVGSFGGVAGKHLARERERPGDDARPGVFEDEYFRHWTIDRVLYVKLGEGAAVAEMKMSNIRDSLP
jgi:hypothetical protein